MAFINSSSAQKKEIFGRKEPLISVISATVSLPNPEWAAEQSWMSQLRIGWETFLYLD